jgi:hypothetical protein
VVDCDPCHLFTVNPRPPPIGGNGGTSQYPGGRKSARTKRVTPITPPFWEVNLLCLSRSKQDLALEIFRRLCWRCRLFSGVSSRPSKLKSPQIQLLEGLWTQTPHLCSLRLAPSDDW